MLESKKIVDHLEENLLIDVLLSKEKQQELFEMFQKSKTRFFAECDRIGLSEQFIETLYQKFEAT